MVLDEVDLGNVAIKIVVKKGSVEERAFAESRRYELEGLLKDGTFSPVAEIEVEVGTRIFGCRFIDELMKEGDRLKKKSRLVAHNYADDGATSIATKAPAVQLFSQRVALCIAVCLPSMKVYTRYITQAYIY